MHYFDGLMRERCNSIANALELRLFAPTHRFKSIAITLHESVNNEHNSSKVTYNECPFSKPPRMTSQDEASYLEGILPEGPYLPCLGMADKALFAGYPWSPVSQEKLLPTEESCKEQSARLMAW